MKPGTDSGAAMRRRVAAAFGAAAGASCSTRAAGFASGAGARMGCEALPMKSTAKMVWRFALSSEGRRMKNSTKMAARCMLPE